MSKESRSFSAKLLLSASLILMVVLPGTAFASARDQVLGLFKTHEVVVFGEAHTLQESRPLLISILQEGIRQGLIRSFSTEYIAEQMDADFQAYLESPTSGPGSLEEQRFFSRITQDMRYVWAKSETNRNFFRSLRALKQEHGSKIQICGNDAVPSHWLPNGVQDSEVTHVERRRQRLSILPEELLAKAQEIFEIDLETMAQRTETNYDREVTMAARASSCAQSGGGKGALVHMGAFHAHSLNYRAQRRADQVPFAAATHFMPTLLPGASIVTLIHAQDPFSKDHGTDTITQWFIDAHTANKGSRTEAYLIDSSRLFRLGSSVLHQVAPHLAKTWDYVILGPRGTYDNVF